MQMHIASKLSRLLRGSERQCIIAKANRQPETAKRLRGQHARLCQLRHDARTDPGGAERRLPALMEAFAVER